MAWVMSLFSPDYLEDERLKLVTFTGLKKHLADGKKLPDDKLRNAANKFQLVNLCSQYRVSLEEPLRAAADAIRSLSTPKGKTAPPRTIEELEKNPPNKP